MCQILLCNNVNRGSVKMSSAAKYPGYRKEDHTTPYAKYYNEWVLPTSNDIAKALSQSPYPVGQLPPLTSVADMLEFAYAPRENGFTVEKDNSVRIAVLTKMPGVTPDMWNWWFAWHGSETNRYKLWHPKAHVTAQWKDGNKNMKTYVGRTSIIEEYIDGKLERAAIQFISPGELGLPAAPSATECFICARIGLAQLPVDFGWLVHQVRSTNEGAEMRSRFWIGGKHIQIRGKGSLAKMISMPLQKVQRISRKQAGALLVHCAEEMAHLAAFLPALYKEFNV